MKYVRCFGLNASEKQFSSSLFNHVATPLLIMAGVRGGVRQPTPPSIQTCMHLLFIYYVAMCTPRKLKNSF